MRTFGPGSVSSFLKTTFDVAYWLLWAAGAALVLSTAGGLLWQPFLGPRPHDATGALAQADALLRRGPALLALALGAGVYLAALLVVVDRLRRVFASMSAGEPFELANVRRLREAGAALAAVQLVLYALRWLAGDVFPRLQTAGGLELSGWFAVLVVFVLAEVFREGARLRAEAALTV
ncbi:MAG: DUF2975 domain-containing protein [Caulobacteraceae bacterium]|nr:DUF2975 domain-containing protein [Caulobacter sp.]